MSWTNIHAALLSIISIYYLHYSNEFIAKLEQSLKNKVTDVSARKALKNLVEEAKKIDTSTQNSRRQLLKTVCETHVQSLKKAYCHEQSNDECNSYTDLPFASQHLFGTKSSQKNHCRKKDTQVDPLDFVNLGIATHCKNQPPALGTTKSQDYDPKYNWIVDKESQFTFCIPPKAACTSWQRFYLALKLNNLEYLDPALDPGDWTTYIYDNTPRLLELEMEENENKNKNQNNSDTEKRHPIVSQVESPKYKKIITSRHPFERIYSGWKDKFRLVKLPSEWKGIWPRRFVPRVRKYTPDHLKNFTEFISGDKEMTVSFEEFLYYLAAEPISRWQDHFLPVVVFGVAII